MTPPDPTDTLARAIFNALAESVDEERMTDDEWNDPEIADARRAIIDAVHTALGNKHDIPEPLLLDLLCQADHLDSLDVAEDELLHHRRTRGYIAVIRAAYTAGASA